MNRKDFTLKLGMLGVCPLVISKLSGAELSPDLSIGDGRRKFHV